ncbi:Fur family ferric uptake transcriptional regulator [Anseongella ginsenosidimutans]|uniref:Fur family ferric uptake transcriptional regulator n=1 Tax=Anseongella ginsenosidimutans TaxID=496056 RepID=A0A4R3KNM0_9SPHI|nr:transcriptional repressor [Anseongella ginsenosidimutans]QEC52476.1 transcriptional repressor [Anseongella ginsenosidimutans]TCS85346.1 Fur family ferric uptake transcriptional regulator [Anseongella ginsenosidimutans]
MDRDGKKFRELLEKHHLKKTGQRLDVLNVLFSKKEATSQPTLESLLGQHINRVTLYRILKTFEEKGIIHRIIDLNGTANYAPCSSACTEHEHHDEHIHFNCTACNKLYCLNDIHIPGFTMPAGFKPEMINMVISGTCRNCNKK